MSVLISIIMPVYNGEEFLRSSLDSALSQSIKELELVCIDDGSTDSSLEILREYEKKDPRVRVFTQQNLGSGPARNLGLEQAKGKYVAFLDSDDFYPCEDTLALLYRKAEENGVMICGGSFSNYADRMPNTIFPSFLAPYVFKEEKLIDYKDYQFDYGYHRFIYNLDFLRKNDIHFPALRRYQDVPFFINAMIAAGKFYAVPDVTYRYRYRPRVAPRDWESVKYRDFLRGILMNLRTAKIHDYKRLHLLTWQHFCEPPMHEAMLFALRRHNYETLELVSQIFNEVDFDLIRSEGENKPQWFDSLQEDILRCFSRRDELLEKVKAITPAEKPVLTVIVPSLNAEPYIRLCIESAMKQTLKNIEILCVDAGSADGTLEILTSCAAADKRIRIIHSDKKSYGYQVNLGIREAKGDYVTILETDDFVAADAYETLYTIATQGKLEVVKGDLCIFRGDGNAMQKTAKPIVVDRANYGRVLSGADMLKIQPHRLYQSMYIGAGVYNVSFLRENGIFCQETPGASFQDNGFWFLLLMHVRRMMFINLECYYLRRDNPNSSVLSKNKTWCMKEEYDYIRAAIEKLPEGELKQKFIKFCAYYRYINYEFTFDITPETEKLAFLRGVQQDFLALEKSGELDFSTFSNNLRGRLIRIMNDPLVFYEEDAAWARKTARDAVNAPKPKPAPKPAPVVPRYQGRCLFKKILQKAGYGLIGCAQLGYKAMIKKTLAFGYRKINALFRR